MKMALIKWLFTRLLPGLLLCAALGAGGGWLHHTAYRAGHDAAKADGDAALAKEQAAHADERQRLTEANEQALLTAQADARRQAARADALAAELLHQEASLALNKNRLSANIDKAVHDDDTQKPGGFTGLGPRGLRLYEQALGYAGDGHARPGD